MTPLARPATLAAPLVAVSFTAHTSAPASGMPVHGTRGGGTGPVDADVGHVDRGDVGHLCPAWSAWQSFGDVLGPGVAELDALSNAPIHATETGAPEGVGGDKAAWIAEMRARLAAHPEVSGPPWSSLLEKADGRVDSSEASLAAYAAGARGH